jgi:hypothetical protein
MRKKTLLALLFILIFPVVCSAEVRVFTLQERAAVDIVDQIRELLDDGEKVQAAGSHLIVIAEGDSLLATEKLVAVLDHLPSELIVRVRFENSESGNTAGIPEPNFETEKKQKDSIRYLGNTRSTTNQVIRLQEGSTGWLEIGRKVPYTQEWSVFAGDISGYRVKNNYLALKTGFWVHPAQVIGQHVLTYIEPQVVGLQEKSRMNPPEVHFSAYHSKAYLPLGKWIPLVSHIHQQDSLGQQILSWHSDNASSRRVVMVRIDDARGFSP